MTFGVGRYAMRIHFGSIYFDSQGIQSTLYASLEKGVELAEKAKIRRQVSQRARCRVDVIAWGGGLRM